VISLVYRPLGPSTSKHAYFSTFEPFYFFQFPKEHSFSSLLPKVSYKKHFDDTDYLAFISISGV
jgi:hypothetical protein